MNTKKLLKILLIPVIFLAAFLCFSMLADIKETRAQSYCPEDTTVQETQATLVGEVSDDGGDSNLTVWFKYGKNSSILDYQTSSFSRYGTGVFCTTVYNLKPCITYYYQAVSENSAGTAYGELESFDTVCATDSFFPPTVITRPAVITY